MVIVPISLFLASVKSLGSTSCLLFKAKKAAVTVPTSILTITIMMSDKKNEIMYLSM